MCEASVESYREVLLSLLQNRHLVNMNFERGRPVVRECVAIFAVEGADTGQMKILKYDRNSTEMNSCPPLHGLCFLWYQRKKSQ